MSAPATRGYEFDSFYLDPQERLLVRDGKPIVLTPKLFETLLLLVQNHGHLLLKDDLMATLWPNSFVEEVNLAQNISHLRKALGDSARDQRYIVTVPGLGYRFSAQVREVTSLATRSIESDRVWYSIVAASGERRSTSGPPTCASESKSGVGMAHAQREVSRWKLALGAMSVLAVIGVFLGFQRQPKLVSREFVVVEDFENRTGESVFDDTLKQEFAAEIQQSPFLRVLSDQKVGETLLRMGRSKSDPLNSDVAREVCQRTHNRLLLSGSIASMGSNYVIVLNAASCASGESLDWEQVEVAHKEEVLGAINAATTRLRRKLGDSFSSLEQLDLKLPAVTTRSLDALKAFTVATKTRSDEGDAAAVPLLKRAIALDPDFPMAYAGLGIIYANLQQPALAAANIKRAYELRDRSSEWERSQIESRYHHFVTGALENASEVYDVSSRTWVWDTNSLVNLGGIYESLGQFEKAIAVAQEAIQRDDNEFANSNLVALYADVNRLDDAWGAHWRAQERKAETPHVHLALYSIAALQGNVTEMTREQGFIEGKRGLEDSLRSVQAANEACRGHLHKAREFTEQAMELALNGGDQGAAALWLMNQALREAEFGNQLQARRDVAAALRLTPTRDAAALGALALAEAGDLVRAQTITDDLARHFPVDTIVQHYWLPTIRAAIELSRNHPAKALELLHAVVPYELGVVPSTAQATALLHPVYVRGRAYLMLQQGREAGAEFQKFLDHRNLVRNAAPAAALAYLGLGRSFATQHETEKARAAYEQFLTLWKGADRDIPVFRQAKSEYSKLLPVQLAPK